MKIRVIVVLMAAVLAQLSLAQTTVPAGNVIFNDGQSAEVKVDNLINTISTLAPLSSPTLTGTPTAPTPALTTSVNAKTVANVEYVQAFGVTRDIRTFADLGNDAAAAINGFIAALNANTIKICSFPPDLVNIRSAINAVTCTDCGFEFNNTLIFVRPVTAFADSVFKLGSETLGSTSRFSARGRVRIAYVDSFPPKPGSYIWDLVNASAITIENESVTNIAGFARFGSATTDAQQILIRDIRGTAEYGADTDLFLFQRGANATIEDETINAGVACNKDKDSNADTHAFFAFRPAAGQAWDTARIGPNVGNQCFKTDANMATPPDGKAYGVIFDGSAGDAFIYNVWIGPNVYLDHTTKCSVLLRADGTGNPTVFRNIYMENLRLTADAGSNFCGSNDRGGLIRNVQWLGGRAVINDGSPHITIRGNNWLAGTITGVNFAEGSANPTTPSSILLLSDGWSISNNFWAPAGSTSTVQNAIKLYPGVSVASIHDNFAPLVPNLVSQPVYDVGGVAAQQRRVSITPIVPVLQTLTAVTGTTATAIPSLAVQLKPGTLYHLVGRFLWRSSSASAGAAFGFKTSAAPTSFASRCAISTSESGTAQTPPVFLNTRTWNDTGSASPTTDAANADMLATCDALVETGLAEPGVTNVMVKSSGSRGSVTLLRGSSLTVEEVQEFAPTAVP